MEQIEGQHSDGSSEQPQEAPKPEPVAANQAEAKTEAPAEQAEESAAKEAVEMQDARQQIERSFEVRDMVSVRKKPIYEKDREPGSQETAQSVEGHMDTFFSGGGAEKVSCEVIDKPPELPLAEIKSVLKPAEEERAFVDANLKAEISAKVKDTSSVIIDKEGKKEVVVSVAVDEMSASFGEKQINLSDMLPEGWKLLFDKTTNIDSNGTCRPKEKEVVGKKMTSLTDFAVLLHECGHAQDYMKEPLREGEATWEQLFEKQQASPGKPVEDLDRAHMAAAQTRERNAWANAMRTVRKFELPILGLVEERKNKSLGIYDEMLGELDKNPVSAEQFATSGKRSQHRKSSKKTVQ